MTTSPSLELFSKIHLIWYRPPSLISSINSILEINKYKKYKNKYNWLADERTRWWFACWCSGVARWIIQEGTAATAAVAMPVDVSFEINIKRSLFSSMTMKTMMGFADLEWISIEWYVPGSRKKRNHLVKYKNKTGWKLSIGKCTFHQWLREKVEEATSA